MVMAVFCVAGGVESMCEPIALITFILQKKWRQERNKLVLSSTGQLVPNIPLAHTDEGRTFFLSQLMEEKSLP